MSGLTLGPGISLQKNGQKIGKDWKECWCGEDAGDALHRAGYPLPSLRLLAGHVHGAGYGTRSCRPGMLKIDDHKFSKSRGYVVWTNDDYLDQGLPADLRCTSSPYTSHTKEMNYHSKS